MRVSAALSFVVSAVLLVGASSPAAAAAPPAPGSTAGTVRAAEGGTIDPSILRSLIDPNRPQTVVLELGSQPVAVHEAEASASGSVMAPAAIDAVRADLLRNQVALLPAIERAGGRVLGQYQDAYDGVKVRVPASAVTALAALPGVVAVHAVQSYKLDNVTGDLYTGVPAAWSSGTRFTGKGVKVAIIDSGIDYHHADFGGSGDPAAFKADDGLTTGNGFPNAKVAGGWDFVGDAYDSSGSGDATVPHPDPDPLDCLGHGTHVAATAAGYGVLADGSTYHGPYDAAALSKQSWLVGPGTAPGATLYALRIFGCSGTTDVVLDAIDWAVKHHMDVINMSLGSPFGAPDGPDAIAVNNAARAGIVVVTAAGNEGQAAYTAGTPGISDGAIAVGAVDAVATLPSSTVTIAGQRIAATQINDTSALPLTAPVHVLTLSDGTISLGCAAADYAPVQPGEIVVAQRGQCPLADRATLGQAAHAAAVVLVNRPDRTDFGPFEGTIPGVSIPLVGVPAATGSALIVAQGTQVTIAASARLANPDYHKLAEFSSAGPRTLDSGLKPDIVAPGVAVTSAGVGTGTGGVTFSGTSMASPHVAGIAALVLQAHPTWTPVQVKAALMNTASSAGGLIAGYDPRVDGSGLVQAAKAVATSVLATTGPRTASLSFGFAAVSGAYTASRTITVSNLGGTAVTYRVSSAFSGSSLGTRVTISPAVVTVPARGTSTVRVTISLSAAAEAKLPGAQQFAQSSALLAAVRGTVTLTPTKTRAGVLPLRVPFLLVLRPLSAVRASLAGAWTSDAASERNKLTLRNTGTHATAVQLFSLGLTGSDESAASAQVRAVGVAAVPSDVAGPSITAGDRLLRFAVNTWHQWSSASVNEFDILILGPDNSPVYDVVLVDHGVATTGQFDGRMATFVFRESDQTIVNWRYATAPTNGTTLYADVLASDIGVTDASPSFSYAVQSFSIDTGRTDVVSGIAAFDAFSPALSAGQVVALPAGASATVALRIDVAKFAAQPSLGWLVVALDNAPGAAQATMVRSLPASLPASAP